jgi:hypothetical protein
MAFALVYLVVFGGLGIMLARSTASPDTSPFTGGGSPVLALQPGDQNQAEVPRAPLYVPSDNTSTPDYPTTSVSFLPTATNGVLDLSNGYTTVSGPGGITTVAPNGWTPVLDNGDHYYDATDPDDSSRFVRYGATTAPTGDLTASLAAGARAKGSRIGTGYQQIQLVATTFHGDRAADWEFRFVRTGVLRHVLARYWIVGDTEFFVYVSATDAGWSDTAPAFQAMTNAAQP